jgi:hypothetical protein
MNGYVTGTSVASADRNALMKFTSMCKTSRKLTHVAAYCMTVLQGLSFMLKILSSQTFTWLCYKRFVSPQIDGIEQVEGEILLQQNGARPTSVTRYEMPWT